jgi:glycosyltransferase involved in cell wall biosynthesis
MFSLVIPTHNRASILERSLAHLFKLDELAGCEVIVVNDGSTDRTGRMLDDLQRAHPQLLRVFQITNGGPGRARNRGVQEATKKHILFIDDDVFPRPGMINSHRQMLEQGYTGSQGLLLWHPEIAITPLIRYLDARGTQFAFDHIKNAAQLGFPFVYTGNFAVEKDAVLKAGGFDETFFNERHGFSAYEDTILGYQLLKNGAKLGLNRSAVADHLHDMTEDGCLRREYKVGYAAGLLTEKYPEIARQLGHQRKKYLPQFQLRLMRLLNWSGASAKFLGYEFGLRLRHREAFYRGFFEYRCRTVPAQQ